ncbi:division/cell wall cluster transcriptional repressor MraZ [Desulfohalovibrio reitneri]|uniref:division/cell wall cluster transcriptional repressor MraZ n=1 Tax=Desulfohalovibrio reitneri TaxID=1307759 RepID=UPI0004A6ED37|nr:division/cell wall cluster transcriptional repressor MraZ [Desulfohalovibrio reitneri]
MFRGHSQRSIDPKGRLMLPPEFREVILGDSEEGRFVLAKFDNCVSGYPQSEWERIEAKFAQIKNPGRKVRDFMRFFIGGAQEVALDKQGRVLVPQSMREYAGLDHEVVLVGVGFKFEVWDQAAFQAIESQDFDDVSEDIASTGVELSF